MAHPETLKIKKKKQQVEGDWTQRDAQKRQQCKDGGRG